ncbi:RNA-binding protein 41-like [Argonauta hians]
MSDRGISGPSFWEIQNYYGRSGGIPCGHPRRYDSGNVVRLPSDSTKTSTKPDQTSKTEGEQQIKYLAEKQLDTKLTKEQYISHKRTFVEKVLYKPQTAELKGICSLDSFSKIQKQDEELEFLRLCGLSEDEICVKKEHDSVKEEEEEKKEEEFSARKRARYGINPTVEKEMMTNINEKINEKKSHFNIPNSFNGARCISRLQMELENSSRNPKESSYLNCLVTTTATTTTTKTNNGEYICEDDPINQLKDISDSLVSKKHASISSMENEDTLDLEPHSQTTNSAEKISLKCKKINHSDKVEHYLPDQNTKVCRPISTLDERSKNDTTSDTPIRDEVVPISKPLISRNCVPAEEILLLDRFKNYSRGEKNNTLYVKNLSKNVTEKDLMKLFSHFDTDQSPVQYKLLSGKMRGQAFITFETPDIAEAALELVHGFVLKTKPVIIQYGKKKN